MGFHESDAISHELPKWLGSQLSPFFDDIQGFEVALISSELFSIGGLVVVIRKTRNDWKFEAKHFLNWNPVMVRRFMRTFCFSGPSFWEKLLWAGLQRTCYVSVLVWPLSYCTLAVPDVFISVLIVAERPWMLFHMDFESCGSPWYKTLAFVAEKFDGIFYLFLVVKYSWIV